MRLVKLYRHGFIILVYGIFYMICFTLLEQRTVTDLHIINIPLDDMIPFCEYFIVPYLFWFVYMFIALLFFIFINPHKREYYQLIAALGTGMTLFLIISWIYPNGLTLRPTEMIRDNIFSDIVMVLYRSDSSTNVFPSIHVFNSIAVHTAISSSRMLDRDRWLIWASLIVTITIIASTVFLKQHSLIDVAAGIALAIISWLVFYKSPLSERFPDY